MEPEYDPQQLAQGKIAVCMEGLIDAFPFHAAILERFSAPDVSEPVPRRNRLGKPC